MMNIKFIENIDVKGYVFMEGFPGAGLVGPMTLSYIIEKLDLDYVGYIESNMFPPLISIHKEMPMPAVRLYHSKKGKFICVFSEFSIPAEVTYEITDKLMGFIKEKELSGVMSIGGMPIKKMDEKFENTIFCIASDKKTLDNAMKSGLKPIAEGISTGVSALLMVKCVQKGISNVNILVPVMGNITDPKYAELAIESINKILKLDIDVKELSKEAKLVEAKIKELVQKGKESHQSYKNGTDQAGPSMYV